jgi:hypothetical protein
MGRSVTDDDDDDNDDDTSNTRVDEYMTLN